MRIHELREQRATKLSELQGIAAAAEAANRDLSADEQAKFGATEVEIRSLDGRIERAEKLADVERSAPATLINGGGSDVAPRTIGEQLVSSPELRSYAQGGGRGMLRVATQAETRSITGMTVTDRRPDIVGLPQRRTVVRDLLPVVRTTASSVEYVRQSSLTDSAAPVAEAAVKPESDMALTVATAPTRVIAHVLTVSRQALDDVDALRSFLDVQMRNGLRRAEEAQLLSGNGTAPNLQGMRGVATAYETARTQVGDSRVDLVHHAIAQLADVGLAATGVVLNLADFSRMVEIKDENGAYIGPGPFAAAAAERLWGVPVAATPIMPAGSFLVGAFDVAATLYDRMAPEVLISSEHSDYFAKNLLLVRCEERVALAVTSPLALVTGSFGAITA